MSVNIKNTWWPEKYRPQTLEEYTADPEFLDKLKYWIETQDPPSLIFFSPESGTGKSSACKLLAKSINCDLLLVNASIDNGIDTVRDKIDKFAKTSGFSPLKIVILEEFSRFGIQAQSALLDVIEKTSATTRFFLTGNYIDRFLPAIVSRCTAIPIQSPPPKQIFERLSFILKEEGKEFENNDLVKVIKQYYPDQRSMLNYLQANTITGKLIFSEKTLLINDYCSKILEELKQNGSNPKTCFKNLRQIIADSKVRAYDDLFKYLFEHLEEFVPEGKRSNVILNIAEFQHKSNLVLDKEIQVAAMFVNILNELQ